MARSGYAKYFHQDFFEGSGPGPTNNSNTNLDIPVIAKVKQLKEFKQVLNEPRAQAYPEAIQEEKKNNVLFNRAPRFFESSFHLQKIFWSAVLICALMPCVKSGFICLISLAQNISKNFELHGIKTKLINDKQGIQAKYNNYHSDSGMKRTIKEEIKVIEDNEILIKIIN